MSKDRDLSRYEGVFLELANAASHLSDEEQEQLGAQLGEYTHDLKHILGLVTGANAIILRSAPSDEPGSKIVEMVEIIEDATAELNAYFDVMIDHLYHPLEED